MKRTAKTLLITVFVLISLSLISMKVYADPVFNGYLDSYENSTDGYAGPIFTGTLEKDATYSITVEGTFSIWSAPSWLNPCTGLPETSPMFPSLSTANGKVGLDAAYLWTYPKTSGSLCPGGTPAENVPVKHAVFEISTDGGTTWLNLVPTDTSYNSAHIYHYEVVGIGDPAILGFRIKDAPLKDNYGRLKISVEQNNQPPAGQPPVAEIKGPYCPEGEVSNFVGETSSDPNGGPLTYAWDFGDGGTTTEANPTHNFGDDGEYKVCLTVTNSVDKSDTVCTTSYIRNVAPTVGPIRVDPKSIQIEKAFKATADFNDPGFQDSHTAVWDWGDGTTSEGTVTENNGLGFVTDSHTYATAGKYTITLTVTDDDGASSSSHNTIIVSKDKGTDDKEDHSGFVSGGGWIESHEGSYKENPKLSGKVTFGFVSKYNQWSSEPNGDTEFQFQTGNINFHGSNYEWLVISDNKAQCKGVGTINGEGEYDFMLTAVDGQFKSQHGADKIRFQVWEHTTGKIIYDTQPGDDDNADPTTTLQNGSIIIHNP